MNSVTFQEHGDFKVVDEGLARLVGGGLWVRFQMEPEPHFDNTPRDNSNRGCVSPNVGVCGIDTICIEVM